MRLRGKAGQRVSVEHHRALPGKRGENKYTLEQFGLDEDEVRELYADYTGHFDIPSEAEGKARARAAA